MAWVPNPFNKIIRKNDNLVVIFSSNLYDFTEKVTQSIIEKNRGLLCFMMNIIDMYGKKNHFLRYYINWCCRDKHLKVLQVCFWVHIIDFCTGFHRYLRIISRWLLISCVSLYYWTGNFNRINSLSKICKQPTNQSFLVSPRDSSVIFVH